MNALQIAYVNALLADASYVEGILKGDIRASDFQTRLTQTQANFLAANFTVKSSVETPNTINSELGTGFDAVVWEGKAGTPYAGQTYVSMRGTQGSTDIADDASLASKGLPYDQIRDMVNWWLKNTASTTDQNVVRIKVVDIPGAVIGKTFALDVPTTGTSVLSGLGSINAVNGLSLGGCGDTSKQPTYCDNWYTDRAAMLQALVTRNEKDIGGIVPGSQNLLYQDASSNTEVLVGAGSSLRNMVRFGSAGAEPLEGGGRTLPLLGMANKLKADKAANNTQWRVAA